MAGARTRWIPIESAVTPAATRGRSARGRRRRAGASAPCAGARSAPRQGLRRHARRSAAGRAAGTAGGCRSRANAAQNRAVDRAAQIALRRSRDRRSRRRARAQRRCRRSSRRTRVGASGAAQHARLARATSSHQRRARARRRCRARPAPGSPSRMLRVEYEWLSTVVVTSVSFGTIASTPSRLRTTT